MVTAIAPRLDYSFVMVMGAELAEILFSSYLNHWLLAIGQYRNQEKSGPLAVRGSCLCMLHSPSPQPASRAEPEQLPLPKRHLHKLPHKLKGLIKRLLRRTAGFIAAQTLPRLAGKTCQLYLRDAHPTYQRQCRQLLRSQIHLDPHQLHRFFQSALGTTLLGWLTQFLQVSGDASQPAEASLAAKRQALKTLLVQMATDPTGLSLLSFVRRFPDQLQLNLDEFLALAEQVEQLLQETDTTIAAIRDLAAAEAAAAPAADGDWPNLTQPGPLAVKISLAEIEGPLDAESQATAPLPVVYYQPDPWPDYPVPVVVQSHGLASGPDELSLYAQHLASYGYFVASLVHTGSNTERARRLLAGESLDMLQIQDFIHRPRQVSHLLDVLSDRHQTDWQQRLNLKAVGLFGHSFGAYTALALAGAVIQFDQLEATCTPVPRAPNLSLLLQCQALELPHQAYSFRDERIAAILCLDAIGSEVFTATGIGQIQVPVLLLAGSLDTTAPLIFEQARIFQWLQTPQRYLALLHGKTHMRDSQRLIQQLNLNLKVLPEIELSGVAPFDNYINALSLAFFQEALSVPVKPSPPLSAAYARFLSREGGEVSVISGWGQGDTGTRGGKTVGSNGV